MSLYVACYDISNGSRRAHIADVLLEFGRRVQASVFEIDVAPEEMEELRLRIAAHLSHNDRFDFYPVDRRQPKRRVSWQRDPLPPDNVIVV